MPVDAKLYIEICRPQQEPEKRQELLEVQDGTWFALALPDRSIAEVLARIPPSVTSLHRNPSIPGNGNHERPFENAETQTPAARRDV